MKPVNSQQTDELRTEYQRSDFNMLVRGKYAAKLSQETNVVVLEADVAQAFPNEKAVNEALRNFLKIMEITRSTTLSNSVLKIHLSEP
jgi:hypothetical protein